jgi:hypothetical protein
MKPIQSAICLLLSSFLFPLTSEGQSTGMQDFEMDRSHLPFSEKTLYWPNNPKGFTRDTLYKGLSEKDITILPIVFILLNMVVHTSMRRFIFLKGIKV